MIWGYHYFRKHSGGYLVQTGSKSRLSSEWNNCSFGTVDVDTITKKVAEYNKVPVSFGRWNWVEAWQVDGRCMYINLSEIPLLDVIGNSLTYRKNCKMWNLVLSECICHCQYCHFALLCWICNYLAKYESIAPWKTNFFFEHFRVSILERD